MHQLLHCSKVVITICLPKFIFNRTPCYWSTKRSDLFIVKSAILMDIVSVSSMKSDKLIDTGLGSIEGSGRTWIRDHSVVVGLTCS